MKRFLIIVGLALTLVGCKTVYVDRIEYRANYVPEGLTRDCVVPAPPNAKAYMAKNAEGREGDLTALSTELYQSIKDCNTDKASIRKWNAEQKALIEKANRDAKK